MHQVHKKASLRVIVVFHHLKTAGCGLVPVTVLPLQNAEALYVGLGLHQIPFEILRPQRSLKLVGPMKETYFVARSVDIEAHTNAHQCGDSASRTVLQLEPNKWNQQQDGSKSHIHVQALYKSKNSSLFHFILQFIVEHVEHGRLRCVTAVCGRGWKCSMVWWKRASRKCRKAQSAFPALASNETWMCDMAGIHHVVGEKLWFATRIAQIDWVMVAFMSWKKSHVRALKLFHRLETCNVLLRSARCRVQQWTR